MHAHTTQGHILAIVPASPEMWLDTYLSWCSSIEPVWRSVVIALLLELRDHHAVDLELRNRDLDTIVRPGDPQIDSRGLEMDP